MIQRCTNAKSTMFCYYGGKGVNVCARWMTFENFLADMGECPPRMEIDRWPNREGNYAPGNCRWATDTQQNRNQVSNRIITVAGFTACVSEVCEHFNLNYRVVRRRLLDGWPTEKAISGAVRL